MAQAGEPRRALRIAQLSSVAGDSSSDLVLFVCAPFLAIMVEQWLDLPEKTALLILSISFVAAVMGSSPGKGIFAVSLGLIVAFIASGEDLSPRLTLGIPALRDGFPMLSAVLGILIVGEIFVAIDNERRGLSQRRDRAAQTSDHDGLRPGDLRRIRPYITQGAIIGTIVGALPGVAPPSRRRCPTRSRAGSTARRLHRVTRPLARARPRALPRPRPPIPPCPERT